MTKTEIKNRLRNLEHLKGFEVNYKSPGNSSGSSIKITDTRFNKSIRIPFDYYYNSAWEIAADYLITKNKINITGFCWNEHKGTYTLLTDDFTTQLT